MGLLDCTTKGHYLHETRAPAIEITGMLSMLRCVLGYGIEWCATDRNTDRF